MPTKDFGRLFVTSIHAHPRWWQGRLLPTRTLTQETEPPWRVGHGLAVRVGRATALVIGWWVRPRRVSEAESEMLLRAMAGQEIEDNSVARDFIGPSAFDLY